MGIFILWMGSFFDLCFRDDYFTLLSDRYIGTHT
jgi:hypothetical protein